MPRHFGTLLSHKQFVGSTAVSAPLVNDQGRRSSLSPPKTLAHFVDVDLLVSGQEMTMDMTVESNRDSKSVAAVPKRSFDVAFLTGNVDKRETSSTNEEEKSKRLSPPTPLKVAKKDCGQSETDVEATLNVQDKLHSANGASAFKKVGKSAHTAAATATTAAASMAAAAAAAASLSEMLPSSYPFSFPAIATTLSLQLLQQNNKSFAMSLFNPMANPLLPNPSKSYPNMLPPVSSANRQSVGLGRLPEASERPPANLIEDYLRAHASLYHDKDLNMGGLFGGQMAHSKSSRIPSSSPSGGPEPLSLASSTPSYSFPPMPDHRASVNPVMTQSILPPSPVLAPPILPVPAALVSLSSPSQNVCAKCNLSFRMTSDLVYHMRSQHRRESDPVRQKRQEKLRCPVCGESFRERHHLTRHMTSHEDREVEAK